MKHQNPLTIVVFGATGDLFQNKLSVALFNLFSEGLLPQDFYVVGFARKTLSNMDFQSFTKEAILNKNKNHSNDKLSEFLKHIKYIQGDLHDLESFKNLSAQLAKDDGVIGVCSNKLFYLSVPPSLYGSIFQNISDAGLTIPCAPGTEGEGLAWTRVLVEKPFGKDIKDAENLDKMLGELFDELQIFRIDHYLGKEAVQNILNFRFDNGIFEPLWNNSKIDKIRIIFHEKNTLAKRGAFYDEVGALRDVGQNHMLQLLALVAMDNPSEMSGESIHKVREDVLEKTYFKNVIVRGQYDGYLNEEGVTAESKTETFFCVNVAVDTPRWQGVTFQLESGKALDKSEVCIEVSFKKVNAQLHFSISSNEGVLHDAYEKVFYDCILGNQTIFVTTTETMAEWKLVTDIIKKWQGTPLIIYPQGSNAEDIK